MKTDSDRVSLNESVGENVRRLRLQARMTQVQLASSLAVVLGKSVDPTTITRMESGARPTTVADLEALSRIFHVPPESLFASEVQEAFPAALLVSEIDKLIAHLTEARDSIKEGDAA